MLAKHAKTSVLIESGPKLWIVVLTRFLHANITRPVMLGVSYVGQLGSNIQDHAARGRSGWKF